MLSLIRKRIGFKLALLFLGVLCLAMGAIVVFNAVYYEDFGQRVVAENELHIKEQAFTFLREMTEQRAQKYQAVFDKLAASSRLIARHAELRFQLANDPPKKMVNAAEYLNVRPANGMFYTDLAKPVTVCYWGGTAIPRAVENELNILLPVTRILVETREQNPEVVASHLIMTSGTGYYYPNSERVYALPPVSELDLRNTNNYVLASPKHNPERKTIWVPVYFDDVGNGLITTVTTPFFGRNGEFLGVAGMDVPLEKIHSQVLDEAYPGETPRPHETFSFLLDERGKIISFPLERLEQFGIEANTTSFNNSFDLLEKGLLDSTLAEVRILGAQLQEQAARTVEFQLRGVPHIVSWQRLSNTHWQLVSVIPQQAFLAPLHDVQQALQQRLKLLQRSSYLMALLFFGCAIGVTLLLLEHFFIKPLQQMTGAAERVKAGDLNQEVKSRRTDEIGALAGTFNGMLAALRQARRMEEEYARQLERQVIEQTQQLQTKNAELEAALDVLQQDIARRQKVEAELITAKALADAANLAKAQFLANVTHELRTPLIGVLGMNELLAGSSLTAAQKSLAATVQRCGESLLEIINDVLDFSKIESGDFTLVEREVEIGLLVEQAVTVLADRAAAKGLRLVCQVELAALWRVLADDLRLRQILLNLIGNAVKFTLQGEISVRLAMISRSEKRGRFVFEVRDTGIGIDEEVQARIFSPFVQGDASPVREFGGTGLGLAIVRQLVNQMGGEIALESRAGVGSRFCVTIELPLVTQNCPLLPEALRTRRVLLQVEHSADREILLQMLKSLGLDAVGVASGDEALHWVESADREGRPFGLLLIGAETRLADGTLLIERLRNEAACAPLSIIAICPRAYLLANGYPADMVSIEEPISWHVLANALGAEWPSPPLGLPAQFEAPVILSATAACNETARRRILIADDYAVTRELVCQLLAGDNIAVDQAACGSEALMALQDHDYELILMDCSMPELDGMEVTRRLRAQGCRIPIVALTAHIDSRVVNACQSAGMNDYLAKPFRRKELLSMVDKWLHVAGGAAEVDGNGR